MTFRKNMKIYTSKIKTHKVIALCRILHHYYYWLSLEGFIAWVDLYLFLEGSCCWLCQHTELKWPILLHTWQHLFLCTQVIPKWPYWPHLWHGFCWLYNIKIFASAGKWRTTLFTASAALAISGTEDKVSSWIQRSSFCIFWSFKPHTNWSRNAVSK